MQTSITTWLKKPATVKEPPVNPEPSLPIPPTLSTSISTSTHDQNVSPPSPLPQPQAQPQQQLDQQSHSNPKPQPHSERQLREPIQPLPFTQPKQPLVKNISIVPCTQPHLSSFQRLNTLLLPIPYPQPFYNEILSDPIAQDLTLLAVWQDEPSHATPHQGRVIAGIRCRILPDLAVESDRKILYISTLGVLSPFRHYGVATHLLHAVIAKGIQRYGVTAVGAHVWEASPEARQWYKKRGFRETHKEDAYYRRLNPQGAFVLRRDIGPRDLL